MKWLVRGAMYRRLVCGIVGEWRDVQKASMWSGWWVEGCTES